MTGWPAPGVLPDLAALGAAVYAGIIIGGLYDLFRLLRKPFRGPVMTWLMDILYYMAATALAAAAMLYINCGTVRIYLFLAMGLGIYLYASFPGRLMGEAGRRLWGRSKKTVARR